MIKKVKNSFKKLKSEIENAIYIKDLTEEELERINPKFTSKIATKGGIDFQDPKIVATGTGYEACIYIYEYPKDVSDGWLSDIFSINNAIVSLDIGTLNKREVITNISKSIDEQESRIRLSERGVETKEAISRFEELNSMYEEIKSYANVMKSILIRVYIPAKSKYEADIRIKEIIEELQPEYQAKVCINETKQDFKNLYLPYKKQQKSVFARKGQPILASTLALGNPFHFDSLQDPRGSYLGQTKTGGTIFWDLFHKDKFRLSYNFLIWGKMGSGKSTLLKKIMKDRAIRGDMVRVFDVEGEFVTLCKSLGGTVVSLDGSSNTKINMFQILYSEDNQSSYKEHISKVKTIYSYLKKDVKEKELEILEKALKLIYVEFGIIDKDGLVIVDIESLPPSRFPTLTTFLQFITKQIDLTENNKSDFRDEDLKELKDIELKIENIATNYKDIFDGYTEMADVYREKVIVFDVRKLINLDSSIFDAQLFSAMAMVWANAITVGKVEKEKYEKKLITEDEITHTLMLIDEAHLSINANKINGVKSLIAMSRQGRKYFAGIGLASQRISDFVPESSSNKAKDELNTLFALSTYRFLMQQDSSDKELLRRAFNESLTDIELDKIPYFAMGEGILSIASYKNLEIGEIFITDEEKSLFTGGL